MAHRPPSKKSQSPRPGRPAATRGRAADPGPARPGVLARTFSAIGSGARSVARWWAGVDPQAKRDSAAFVLVGVSVVVALREWFRVSGQAGTVIHHAVAGLVGIFSVVVPLVLLALAVELFRARSGSTAVPHHVAGGTGIVVALTGLVHVSAGNPDRRPIEGLESAGGLVGWFVARPLVTLLSPWGAAAILVLLFVYSVLVATRTRVAEVPARLRELRRRLSRRPAAPDAAAAGGPRRACRTNTQ